MKSKAELIVGISGFALTADECEVLLHSKIHGVILFTRNYQNPQQLQALNFEIHALRPKNPLMSYVDQEGGRVQRFREGFTTLPAPGDIKQNDAFAWGELMASELKICGVDYSFAPTVDLDRGSLVIGNRAFSSSPQTVIACASEYIAGMEKAGMMGIIKHFPGHGSVTPDTHQGIAIDERSLAEIEQSDLLPFIHFAKEHVGMMVSHVIYPKVDSEPASLSKFWMSNYLRGTLQFKGPIFTDDLGMKAVSEGAKPADLVMKAFSAGADYALLCNEWGSVLDTLKLIG